ncbi:MAG: hypothetical protein ACR2MD_18080 [Aridibacter sp.]
MRRRQIKKIKKKKDGVEKPVTVLEDLMCEHGVLCRALLVYTIAAIRLRKNPADVAPDALQKMAKLFRAFGKDYHEKKDESQINLVFLQGCCREFIDGFFQKLKL